MTQKDPRIISIQDRLKNVAKKRNRPVNEIYQYYGMERFLFRLMQSQYAERFILKGGLLISALDEIRARATRDIDLLGYGSNQEAVLLSIVRDVCEIKGDDGVDFDFDSFESRIIKEGADYEGVRVKVMGYLGRVRLPIQVDFGFGDVITPDPIAIQYPMLLEEISFSVRGYPPETIIAEKYQALVELGQLNSRMKDYYDLDLLLKSEHLQPEIVWKAIKNTFQNRKSDLPTTIPIGLSEEFIESKQGEWNAFLKRTKLQADDFSQVVHRLRHFFQNQLP